MNYRTKIKIDGKEVETLKDILPEQPGLDILFIAKTPALKSVEAGHYFQGTQGTMFWNRLREYGILENVSTFEDEGLLGQNYGITDIVKVPRNYGNEPSNQEYQDGLRRILDLIQKHSPRVIVFVYKKVLDQILKNGFNVRSKSQYGFNHEFAKMFGSEVFVFPMPGTPCSREQAQISMDELVAFMD